MCVEAEIAQARSGVSIADAYGTRATANQRRLQSHTIGRKSCCVFSRPPSRSCWARRWRSRRPRNRAPISSDNSSPPKAAPPRSALLRPPSSRARPSIGSPGQSYSPTGEPRFLGDSTYTQTVDSATRTARVDWDRDMKYPAVERLKYSEITTPTFGILIDDKGAQQPMSGIRLAAHLRERERASPRLLVRALDAPDSISALPDQKIGDRSLPAVSIKTRAGTFIVLFDRTTHLPAAIRTRDADNVYGDSNYDMILSDWKDVAGAKRAHTLSFQLNGMEVQRLTLKEVTVNAPIAADTFTVSDEVKAKAKTAATDAPYQWVLRRLFLGRFLDSDKVYYPEGGGLKLTELAPNVQHVVGGTHNSLIVAMKDGIVVFDAPIGEGQSRWVIDAAKAKYPGKPIKQLVLTHHHMDHSSGTRTYGGGRGGDRDARPG